MSWIVETSEQKIGQVWTAEDHAELVRQIREAEKLAMALIVRNVEPSTVFINGVSE